ncbi:MAG: ECF transporter S component [Ruminococcaceae bacterium]|nr:ECF transporter S component [Oscillospiraceae bacterium]
MKNQVKQMVLTALFIAVGVVLPQAFHAIPNAGSVMLPMHIPVLLAGLVCGPVFGLACGIITPVMSSLITGMPGMAYLPAMLCELAIYGLVSGLVTKVVKTGKPIVDIYAALITSMLAGRVIYGIVNALIFRAGEYSMSMWLTASFVTALPGIIIQLVAIPIVIMALRKAKLIEG